MNHEEIKILLSAYLDGEVTPSEKDLVEDHLASCASCQKEFVEFKKISSSLKRWPQERLSPDVELNIKARLGKNKERDMEKREMSIQWNSVMVVVFVLALSTWSVHYAQRSLQHRVRNAQNYLSSEPIALSKTDQYEPYYLASNHAVDKQETVAQDKLKEYKPGSLAAARLKSATDDISQQFSPGSTNSTVAFYSDAKDYGMEKDRAFQESTVGRAYLASNSEFKKSLGQLASSGVAYRDKTRFQQSNYNAVNRAPLGAPLLRDRPMIAPGPEASYSLKHVSDEKGWYAERRDNEYDQAYYPPSPEPNTESYEGILENAFLNPANDPLSTFSIDVDTASYSNVRRFLNQGQLPPVDSVRIEELVNYFSYDYPEPMWGQPLSVTTEVAPCPWNPSHQLALVGVQGKHLNQLTMPASNLVFLIDVSGSMNQPDKLPLLQDAFRMLTSELESKDRISIVVYAGAAGLVLEATPGNYKQQILDAIDRLSCGGSTAGGAGIQLAYQTARANFIPNGNNRVILATDGDFNVGVSDDAQLVQMITNYRNQGIFLTVLGFGTGNYKDSKMEKLADQGNGNYFYIDNNREAHKVLVRELGSTLFTIAKDVKIQVEFNPATVESYRLVGYENRALAKEDFNNDRKDAGELGAGHTVTALYEIVPNRNSGYAQKGLVDPLVYQKSEKVIWGFGSSSDVMTVKLRYKEPKGEVSKLIKKTVSRNEIKMYNTSDNFRFAGAVAEFGLVLRQSQYRGMASFDHVLGELGSVKQDSHGDRQELVGLVERAKLIAPYIMPMQTNAVYPEGDGYQMEPSGYSHPKSQK